MNAKYHQDLKLNIAVEMSKCYPLFVYQDKRYFEIKKLGKSISSQVMSNQCFHWKKISLPKFDKKLDDSGDDTDNDLQFGKIYIACDSNVIPLFILYDIYNIWNFTYTSKMPYTTDISKVVVRT